MTAARKLPVAGEPPKWNHKAYGSITDPFHKSHASMLVGEFSCLEQFRREKIREIRGEERTTLSGKTEMGTAAHNTIRRALISPEVCPKLLAGPFSFSTGSIRKVLETEFAKATDGRETVWYGRAEREDALNDCEGMISGLFADIHRHVAAVELVEAGWIAKVGKYWTEGHIDLVYRPRANPSALAITDWKTGALRPHPIALDHGYESGLYSNALACGLFVPEAAVEHWRELGKTEPAKIPLPLWDAEALVHAPSQRHAMHVALRSVAAMNERGDELPREVVRFNQFPEEIRLTHLADYLPYERKGKKRVSERPEDIAHWSRVFERAIKAGEEIQYEKGMQRGPAWLPVRRTSGDVARLEKRLSALIGWIRMGLFTDAVGEKCTRCTFRGECLTSGYEVRGDEAKALAAAMRGIDVGTMEMEL